MRSLYRLQTRLGLTGPEGTALLVVSLALAFGFAASEWTARAAPPSADLYAAQDSAFALVEPPDSLAAAGRSAEPHTAELAPDAALPSLADGALPPDSAHADPEPPAEDAPAAVGPVADAPRRSARKTLAVTNVNTASVEQMQQNLPRIGPALAGRIAEYRRQYGRFSTVEQLIEVRGIGEKTLEGLRPWVRL